MGKASRKKKVVGNTPDTRPVNSVEKTMSESSREALLCVAVIILVSFAVYFNALLNGFVYDDAVQVLGNPWITDIRHFPEIFSRSVWSFQAEPVISNYYRPLMHTIYMFNYHVFGLNPWGFHLVNILFHVGGSILVFIIAARLLKEYKPSSPHIPPFVEGSKGALLSSPFIAALLFATHPIHTEAVTWIAGLPDVAFTFFYLLSFYLYIRSKPGLSGNYIFSVGCFAVAVFFKEPALTLPVILLAYDYVFRETRPRLLDNVKKYIPYLVIGVVYVALRMHALGGFAPQERHETLSAYQYIINVFPLFMQYLEKLLLPIDLNAFYVLHPISSLFEVKGAVSLAVTISFLAFFIIALRRSKVVFLGLLLVAAPLLPVLYIPALGENTFTERYLYLPSVGFAILLTVLLTWLNEKLPHKTLSITTILFVLVGLFSVWTVTRNSVWRDDYTLFSDMVIKSPDGHVPRFNLGKNLLDKGYLNEAIEQWEIAVQLKPNYADAHYNLGNAYHGKGWIDKAIDHFRHAVAIEPNTAAFHNNLGVALGTKGLTDKAIVHFQTAVQLKPDYTDAHYNLGNALLERSRIDEAIEHHEIAQELNPALARIHYSLGNAYGKKGWIDKAVEQYRMALSLQPDYADAHFNLGDIYLRKGIVDMARQEFEAVLRINPDNSRAREILNALGSK